MGKWARDFQYLIWFAGIAVGCLIYISQVYATKEYVEQGRDGNRRILEEVHKDVREIRDYLMRQ